MRTNLRAALILVIVMVFGRAARADRLAISDVRSEADVADEAGAISLLVRSALAGPGRTLLPVPESFTLGDAPALLAKINADHALLLDLAREGTGLRLSLAIAGGGRIEAAMLRSGHGDLQSLAQGVVDRVNKSLGLSAGTVRDIGLARLRPFAIAIRLATSDPPAAARALAEANPLTVLSVGAVEEGLRGLPASVTDRTLSAIAAYALRDLTQLDKLATGTDPPAVAAQVFAAILRSNLTGVDEVLKRAPRRNGLFAIARLVLAQRIGDSAVLADRIKEGLTSDQVPAVLAVVSLLTLDRLPVSVQRAVLAYAEKPGLVSTGIASRIGLAAALAGTDPLRALALVKWYVHLYGTFSRGGELRTVPDTCSELVEVKRGDRVKVEFNLTSKLAEVTFLMESEPRRGVVVWANNAAHDKRYTDPTGKLKMELPIGTHTLHIDVNGQRFERIVQVGSAKMQRITFNMTRELRLAQGVSFDANEVVPAELEIAPAKVPTATPRSQITRMANDRTQLPAAASDGLPVVRMRPRAKTPIPGELLLGRYKIVSELGRGAMGIVHRALDEKLEREVAIKEMAEDLLTNAEAMRLFTQEAKALAQLNHTNIVGMYDQVTETDKVYMIMEFVDGVPLAEILESKGKLPWRDAVAIVDQVCAGLAFAHARKVIHRDIKPANIFVTKDRTAKLGDFGLARVMREVTIQRTEIRGTPLYMAPEQITGTDVDHRTDLYAIGCTFFEFVCGRPPFIDGDVLYAHMHTPPPSARELCPDLPEAIDVLIQSLIAKSSDDRPGSANEVRAAMKSL